MKTLDIHNIQSAYFLGIGGRGMSAIARYFNEKGAKVAGFDRQASGFTAQMEAEGIAIHYQEDINLIPDQLDLVVYTPALTFDMQEYNYLAAEGYTIYKRAEVLEMISREMFTIAIAGSHGKTTTTAMVAHILKHSGYDCTAFIGGTSLDYNSNFIGGNNNVLVVEADEYDRSFHRLHPNMAVVTSMSDDHLDIYGSWEQIVEGFEVFINKIEDQGTLILKNGLKLNVSEDRLRVMRYHLDHQDTDYSVSDISIHNGGYRYHITSPQGSSSMELNIAGRHNVENSVAAFAIAQQLGIDERAIAEAMATFSGVKSRFQYLIREEGLYFVDDYAHHPTEIEAAIVSAREMFPGRKLTYIFQPHLYSRTQDLHQNFASSLSKADEVILMEICGAREEPIEGVSTHLILDELENADTRLYTNDDLAESVQGKELEVVIVSGCGDVHLYLEPVKEALLAQKAVQ